MTNQAATAGSRQALLARRRQRIRRIRRTTVAVFIGMLLTGTAFVIAQTSGRPTELSLNAPADLPRDI